MLQSKLFYKTEKNLSKDEVSRNAQLLVRAGYVDKLMAGVYTLLPLGLRVMKKIENIIRREMDAIGGQELVMPALHPKENWLTTGRWESMDEDLYKLKIGSKEYVLGATHEEILTPLLKKTISSYRDLPVYLYQFQNKFRKEKRAKSGLLRGREFVMKDLYSFHTDENDLDEYYEKAVDAYKKVFNACGIGDKTYLTYASGGTFSKYSHEFQTLTEAGEDLIYICGKCKVAVNKEILDDQENKCPECGNTDLREENAVEVGNVFKLKTKYSKPFGLTYLDKDGKNQDVIMGCYGIGLQRVMGTIVELFNDEKGIIWPQAVAPFQVHLIAITGNDEEVQKEAENLYEKLNSEGIEVLYDDRKEVNPGQKFAESDLIGIPYRIVVSAKTLKEGKFELKKRNESEAKLLSQEEMFEKIKS